MTVTDANYLTSSAKVTLSGYNLVGIKVGDYQLGIKHRYKITFLINKQTGVICCTVTERNFD